MTIDELKEYITNIHGLYPSFKYSGTETLNAWFKELEDTPLEKMEKALKQYLNSGKTYAPTLADLKKLIPRESGEESSFHCLMKDKDTGNYFIFSKIDGVERRSKCHQVETGVWMDEDGYLWAKPEG